MDKFKWIDFYTTFATKLLSYKHNRSKLIEKIQNTYKTINMNLPKLESNGIPKDIDPFTVFGLFNKGIRDDTRKKIIEGFIKEFGVNAEIPDDFAGIPTINNMSATFYAFEDGSKNRKKDDIYNIWKLFEAAINLANNDNSDTRQIFSFEYDHVLKQYGIKWNITMGLFWIRPNTYINLDSRNRWFIGNSNNIASNIATEISKLKEVPSANKYLEICDKCLKELSTGNYAYRTLPELSYYAWIESEKENNRQNEQQVKQLKLNDIIENPRFQTHYWLFAPGENASQWKDFQQKGIMGIGWKELGDFRRYKNKDEILSELSKMKGGNSSPTNDANAVWQFINDIRKGDIIFAKRGRNEIIGRTW